jgi:predicted CXXCH cytochrome family protein
MKKIICLNIFLISVIFHIGTLSAHSAEAPRNPDSAKECAICHYRWIDTFFIDGRGSDLVEYQAEKVVAKPEICFSCHDGSVVDSRARVYNDLRHKINSPPPEHMKIPKIFPMDKDGNMQCSTCHTAHGVSSEMGIEKTIFIRSSNRESGMCRMCHADKDGGPKFGNHPLGSTEREIPKNLKKYGALTGEGKNHIICETCHTVHGSGNESFLIESARNSRLCLECHADKNIFTPDGKRNHFHIINVVPGKVEIPVELIKKGAKLGKNGEIICQRICFSLKKTKNQVYALPVILTSSIWPTQSTILPTPHLMKRTWRERQSPNQEYVHPATCPIKKRERQAQALTTPHSSVSAATVKAVLQRKPL